MALYADILPLAIAQGKIFGIKVQPVVKSIYSETYVNRTPMGLYSSFGLDRYSVLTGLTENVNLTGNMSDHEDKKDLGLNSDTEEICICGTIR